MIQPTAGRAVIPQPGIRADHLRDRQTRAESSAQLPERPVADASHRGQKDGWKQGIGAKLHGRAGELRGGKGSHHTGMPPGDEPGFY